MPKFGRKGPGKPDPEAPENKPENSGEKTSQELSTEFLRAEESGTMNKLKTIFNVLRPHEFEDTFAKIVGALNIWSGAHCANIAFNHPEQMLINDPTPAKFFSIAVSLLGASMVAVGIDRAYEKIKREKKWKAETTESNN